MSTLLITEALETALNGMSPALATAWENIEFAPVVGTPYQRVWFMPFVVKTPEVTKSHQVVSYFQIDLMYPELQGSGAVLARAELIKALFKKSSTFTNGGVTVTITEPPTIGSGSVDGDRWKVCVKIYYSAWIIVN